MKKQVVVIHGGDAFNTYADYIKNLKQAVLEEDDLTRSWEKGWKDNLQEDLGHAYEVFNPSMPSAENAKYAEWKIWFEKILIRVRKGAVFVGHSLGGIFLARYFAEHGDTKDAAAVFLVAAPFNDPDSNFKIADFVMPRNIAKLKAMAKKIHLYQSKDDTIVRFSNINKYKKALPAATAREFTGKGHFLVKHLPEIVADIKSL